MIIRMKKISIVNLENGEKKVLKSGDQKAWKTLTKEEKYWVKSLSILKNPEMYTKTKRIQRILSTNDRKYIPVYEVIND